MTNELEILKSVNEENKITQRELAKRTGLSLGTVNVLIKRLIHKGLIKIEHINSRTIKYVLTPKGIAEKARLTYQYIVNSYYYIISVEQKIEQIISNKNEEKKVILYGEKDELYDIITAKLRSKNKEFAYVQRGSDLSVYTSDQYIIITWHPEDVFKNMHNCDIVNIL